MSAQGEAVVRNPRSLGERENQEARVPHGLLDLLQDPTRIQEIPPAVVPALLAQVATLQTALLARLLTSQPNGGGPGDRGVADDRLLTVDEAARLLATSPDWLYRNAKKLPFTVRVGRHLRFSSQGIARYIRQRQGR